jgi:hypothetical protein
MVRSTAAVAFACLVVTTAASAQTPQPFPRPGTQTRPSTLQPPPEVPPQPAAVQQPTQPPAQAPAAAPVAAGAPSAEEAYFPLYPTAQFIAAYDAGRGQRYLVYGATAPYAELVAYYRNQLRERGNTVFDDPPTHMFEVGRFRSETMAFPPGVTIKDWTAGGSMGYPNPKPGAEPARFPTIIMLVPPPPAAPASR